MDQGNQLFPVFFRLDHFDVLVVGGGYIGLEKITAIFNNSQNASVTLVAPEIHEEIRKYAEKFPNLQLRQKPYTSEDLAGKGIVMAATSITALNRKVYDDAKARNILINVADTPELCDFYLSSIVRKGDLKIAISTNGKSPTFAKRIREMFEEILPDNLNTVLDNLKSIQKTLKGDFEYKAKKMDEITRAMQERKGPRDPSN